MIRFCDKEVYTIHEGDMSRIQMFVFFLEERVDVQHKNGHLNDVLMVFDEKECYKGIITSNRLMSCQIGEEILEDVLTVSDSFWEEGRTYFAEHPDELVPVVDKNGNVLGFCWDDDQGKNVVQWELGVLESAYEAGSLISVDEVYPNVRMACIYGCNEFAWLSYQFLKKIGMPVCLIGEEWEWFGVKTMENCYAFPEWAKLSIYAEGTELCCGKHRKHIEFPQWTLDWIEQQRRASYRTWTKILERKGIRYCRFMVPDKLKNDDMTDQEIRNMIERVLIYDENYMKQDFTKKQMEALQKTVNNKEELEFLLEEKKTVTEKWRNGMKVCLDNGVIYVKCEENNRNDKKYIYLLGTCILLNGYLVKNKILGILQELVVKEQYTVVSSLSIRRVNNLETLLAKIPIKSQDIVVILDVENVLKELDEWGTEVSLRELYEDPNRSTWIIDGSPTHINSHGNRAIAKEIYEKYVKEEIERLKTMPDKRGYLVKGEILSPKHLEQVQTYVEKVIEARKGGSFAAEGTAGAVVMNCNPFTYGHQYLIEYAAGKVDLLYIFVVEEDCSDFSFKQRMEMVKMGCGHLNNVCVVPSGSWVLSYDTFSAYFEKSERQEQKVDAWMDLEIFARYIAPPLGITCRFVGEEPTDKVTRQYNEQMKDILADFEIEVEEVPRKEVDGKVISASYVRKCLKNEWIEDIRRFVPESTIRIIKERI